MNGEELNNVFTEFDGDSCIIKVVSNDILKINTIDILDALILQKILDVYFDYLHLHYPEELKSESNSYRRALEGAIQ